MFISAMRRKWQSAGQLAQHLLQQKGPQTTQQLWKLTQAVDAPAEKEYIAPHHRDYRIVDGQIRGATIRPPSPKHIVRSVRHLKQTLQGLEATSTIGHLFTPKWVMWTERDASLADLHAEAKEIRDTNKAAGESDYVWIDGERYHKAKQLNPPVPYEERQKARLPLGRPSTPLSSELKT